MSPELPNIDPELLDIPTADTLAQPNVTHKPRILLLYGSNRARSYSRLLTEEAARFCFVWIIMIGSMIAVRDRSHFDVDLLPHPKTPRQKGLAGLVVGGEVSWSFATLKSPTLVLVTFSSPRISTREPTMISWRNNPPADHQRAKVSIACCGIG